MAKGTAVIGDMVLFLVNSGVRKDANAHYGQERKGKYSHGTAENQT